jgi:putative aldouronate transport system permease protein
MPSIKWRLGRRMNRTMTVDKIVFDALGYALLIVVAVLCILPFYLIIVGSFTDEGVIIRKGFSFTVQQFSLEGYRLCLKNPRSIWFAYRNTILVTIIGTTLSVFIATMTGYVLQRRDFPWRNKFSFFFYFTMLFNGGLVPWYILCVRYLGFKNQPYALVLPLLFSVWNMIICKTFIRSIPEAITDSAKIDGANDFVIYLKLILPLSKPLIATIGLFSALAYWNDWYNCMLFIDKENLFTLQYYLQRLLGSVEALRRIAEKSGMAIPQLPIESMKMAMTVIATGPIILVYPLVQRYFVKGLTIGAIKG